MRTEARLVIVGAGIVGCSTALHLAKLGFTDVLVIDQGRLSETGRSISHAPGGVFQTNPSRVMATFAKYTVGLLNALDLDGQPSFLSVGGLEIATTEERARDLKRRYGLACSWGIPAALVSPERRDPAGAGSPFRNYGWCRRHARSWVDAPAGTFRRQRHNRGRHLALVHVTSAAYGYTIGRQIAYGYLPAALTTVGSAVEIEYLGRCLKATVASEPLLDSAMARLKARRRARSRLRLRRARCRHSGLQDGCGRRLFRLS